MVVRRVGCLDPLVYSTVGKGPDSPPRPASLGMRSCVALVCVVVWSAILGGNQNVRVQAESRHPAVPYDVIWPCVKIVGDYIEYTLL